MRFMATQNKSMNWIPIIVSFIEKQANALILTTSYAMRYSEIKSTLRERKI